MCSDTSASSISTSDEDRVKDDPDVQVRFDTTNYRYKLKDRYFAGINFNSCVVFQRPSFIKFEFIHHILVNLYVRQKLVYLENFPLV